MPRPPRALAAAAVALVLLGGGYLIHLLMTSPHSAAWPSGGPDAAQRLGTGSVLVAEQPAPSPTRVRPGPSLTPSPSATPKPSVSPTPTPSKTSPKPKPTKPKPRPTKTAPASSQSVVDQLLAQINDLRAQNGLPPYSILSGLNASAHKHNLKMEGSCGMQHQCPGESSLGARISAEGVHWSSCGENIGWSGPHPDTTSALVQAAEGLTTAMYDERPPDDGHRKNLLSTSFHHVGIDVVRDSSGKVWLTQDFSS